MPGTLQALSGREWEAWLITQEPVAGLGASNAPADGRLYGMPFENTYNPNDTDDYLFTNASGQYLVWMRPGKQGAPGLAALLSEQVTSHIQPSSTGAPGLLKAKGFFS